jgi:hypothetical protein
MAAASLHGMRQPDDSDAGPVAAAMLRWRIGIERAEPPYEMVETIAPALLDGRRTWRVTHYAFDPTGENGAGFDLYDVDAVTFAPIRSVMRNPEFELSLSFDPAAVVLRRTEKGASTDERIALKGPVKPEGPGQRVFIASLPLKVGYTLEYQLVDRWSGKDRGRLKDMTLTVRERRQADTALGRQDILDVAIVADDGAFQIVEQVRATPPHYPFRVEYSRGKSRLVSDVTSMAIEARRR